MPSRVGNKIDWPSRKSTNKPRGEYCKLSNIRSAFPSKRPINFNISRRKHSDVYWTDITKNHCLPSNEQRSKTEKRRKIGYLPSTVEWHSAATLIWNVWLESVRKPESWQVTTNWFWHSLFGCAVYERYSHTSFTELYRQWMVSRSECWVEVSIKNPKPFDFAHNIYEHCIST